MGSGLAKGLQSLLASEKALAAFSLIIGATVLVILGHMTVDQWTSYTQVIFGGYIIGKTAQGAVSTWADAKKPDTSVVSSSTVTVEAKEVKTDASS